MSDTITCDLAVIGAGPGGYATALRGAAHGLRVVLVERGPVGGACLNRGCIPTKAWVAAAETVDHVPHMASFARAPFDYAVDFGKVSDRQRKIVAQFVGSLEKLLEKRGARVVRGSARFASPTRIVVDSGATVDFRHAVVATGTAPVRLFDLPGDLLWDSDTIFSAESLPPSMLVIGAGYIGCEFAGALARFGVKTTLIESLPRILPMADEEVSSTMGREFKKQKIGMKTGVKIAALTPGGEGVVATFENGDSLTAGGALVSVGRRPVTGGLGLDAAGVAVDGRGFVVVNGAMTTTVPHIHAVGDLAGRGALAYTAYREGAYVADRIAGKRTDELADTPVPNAVFTIPEVGSVGITEAEAPVGAKVGRFMTRGLARAHTTGELAGFVKVIAHPDTDAILGVHMVGARATDLIHIASVAMAAGLTARRLGDLLFAHPAFAEGLLEAVHDVHGLALHQ
ncbi:MAG: dihydrolipoyl dehydrogenase [Nitrospinae bacterium]|nr:dihydrolipoyl dehydrogenase [Nitrospinota bacterium]